MPAQLHAEHPRQAREGHVRVDDPAGAVQDADDVGEKIGDSAPGRLLSITGARFGKGRFHGRRRANDQVATRLGDGQLERQPACADVVAHPAQGLDVIHPVAAMSRHRPFGGQHAVAPLPRPYGVCGDADHRRELTDCQRDLLRIQRGHRSSLRIKTVATRASLPWASAPTVRHRSGARLKNGPPTKTGTFSALIEAIVALSSRVPGR